MPDNGPSIDRSQQLKAASDDAYQLLHYVAQTGKTVAAPVHAAIAEMKHMVDSGADVDWRQEAAFLAAYQQLAETAKPVTAQSLRETDDVYGTRGVLRRVLGLRSMSDAKRVSVCFSAVALLAILAITVIEFGENVARTVIGHQREAIRLGEENHKVRMSRIPIERHLQEIRLGAGVNSSVLETLERQREELEAAEESLTKKLTNSANSALEGYRILSWVLAVLPFTPGESGLPLVIEPMTGSVSRFILPLLYGLLGACAYVLRSVIYEMQRRSFERRRFADYGTRVYLGMLSGVTVQWIFVGTQESGFTPAVLAFAGGYSVEMIFTLLDRVIHTVTDAIRPTEARIRDAVGNVSGA